MVINGETINNLMAYLGKAEIEFRVFSHPVFVPLKKIIGERENHELYWALAKPTPVRVIAWNVSHHTGDIEDQIICEVAATKPQLKRIWKIIEAMARIQANIDLDWEEEQQRSKLITAKVLQAKKLGRKARTT